MIHGRLPFGARRHDTGSRYTQPSGSLFGAGGSAPDVEWLKSDRRYPDERPFPGLAAIAMIEATTEHNGRRRHEKRYYITSAKLDANAFAAAVRAHWGIENSPHWVLDVVFHDDLARLRSGHGPQNMAVVKHMAMNLIRHPKDKHSLKNRRKLACLNPDYLETLIRNQPR